MTPKPTVYVIIGLMPLFLSFLEQNDDIYIYEIFLKHRIESLCHRL